MRRSNIYSILQYASCLPLAFFQDVSASPLKSQILTGESPNAEVSAEELLPRSLSTSPSVGPNFPDPCIININGKWYAFATRTIGSGINVPVASSPDYKTWTIMTNSSGGTYDALPTMPPWVDTTPNQWAPDVGQLADGSFIMYFSATTKQDTLKHCVGAAKAKTVTGPYTPLATPLFCNLAAGGAIDASNFVDTVPVKTRFGTVNTYQRYVAYKVDGNSLGHGGFCGNTVDPIVPTPLMLQAVAADGVTLQGAPTQMLDNRGVSDDGVIEAPDLVRSVSNGVTRYFLFFSSGCFTSTHYTVSYAVSTNGIKGPYTRAATPLLATGSGGLQAPGGADVWADSKSMVFHAGPWGNRQMYTAQLNIQGATVSV